MNRESDRARDKRYAAFLLLAGILLLIFFANAPQGAAPPPLMPILTLPFAGARGAAPSFPGFPININTADAEELMMLPGVGDKTARRIIEKRAALGGFKSVEDLLEIKYIGEAKLEGIRAFATVKKGG